ncbi:fatty acyl-AMP ligase [Dermatobacter hominis]|uniref:fatty acyl-AMP ligase n=1 Tax=Dermatobacter hominis TaxID=2884263 RepID=UPI001D10AC09|nr:fatty acyl-AMP ligase [Dermatobacter hominis]UDY35758.1 fatty acyl-AMP ligase [Dermatobacter hominis]
MLSSELSLISRIESVAERGQGKVTFVAGDDHETLTWGQLHAEARAVAAALQARGVGPGDHVALLGPTTRRLVTAIQAIWLTGGALVTMPLPMRMGALDQFIEQTRARIRRADSKVVVIDSQLADFVEPVPGDPPFIGLDSLFEGDGPTAADYVRPADDPSALAVLQFTSGSTSEPKGVMLPHENICHNLDGAWTAAELTHDEVIVSWLPLYHDMGLVGLLTIPMTRDTHLVQGAPQDFLAKPIRWMRWLTEFHGTASAGPNFSYALAARALKRTDEQLELSQVRMFLNGAEPIDAPTFRRFLEAGERFGLEPGVAFPAFGMAEVCIAGCFPTPGKGLVTDVVDRTALETEHRAVPVDADSEGSTELALLGRPVPGLEIEIIDTATGEPCADRQVGELRITGNSVTTGYYQQPEATEELIVDGWLHTGDLAYTVGGELVICGRIKDVIIVGGRNVYPQDIEKVVGEVEGVRTGNVIAFGIEGRQGAQNIIVVAESKASGHEELRREITRVVTESVGIPPKEVILVQPGSVPKTSSGKLQRSACRLQYLADELDVLQPA